jgi:hypothetical protein
MPDMRRIGALAVAFALAFGVMATTPGSASAIDSSGWTYNSVTKHSYAQINGVTWADAEAYAVRVGGHLVTIEDQTEQDWLATTFPQPELWIGLNDRAREGQWTWSSGKRVTYTNWLDGQPDDWMGFDPLGEDAAVLVDGRWDDISGRWLGSGIIEVNAKPIDVSRNLLPWGTHDGFDAEQAAGYQCYANGWAFDPDNTHRDATVRILAMRTDITMVPAEIWRGPADQYRPDVPEVLGIGDETTGFWVDLRPYLAWGLPYEIRVQAQDLQTGEWWTLDNSPRPITCTQFDPA